MDDWQSATAALAELELCEKLLKEKRPEVRRFVVRVIASCFETLSFAMKHMAGRAVAAKGTTISPRERELITPISEPPFPDGPPPRRVGVGARESLNVAITVYARARGAEPPLETSPLGDPALPPVFLVMERILDRIHHPEEPEHLEIDKQAERSLRELLKWARTFRQWLNDQRVREIDEIKESIRAATEEVRRKILAE